MRLARYPRAVREALGPRGRWVSELNVGSEIRFVTDAPTARLHITNLDFGGVDADLFIFRGDFLAHRYALKPGSVRSIALELTPRFDLVRPDVLRGRRFDPGVWRLSFGGSLPVLHEVETQGYPVRPPHADEKPRLTWLAYGSSITGGSGASIHLNSYVEQAAWRLGVDALNMGLGGSCLCEPAVADYFASRDDWDFATLELGVNMAGSVAPEEFRRRAEYLVGTLRRKHPDKLLVLITSFPFAQDLRFSREPNMVGEQQQAYDAILREIASRDTRGRLRLVEGHEVLTDFPGLSWDLVHPSDHGHIQMGENLAKLLRPMLETPAS